MKIEVLGGFRVSFGSSGVDLGTPKQRTVLAKLVMNPSRTVAIEELIDEIWPDDPPRSAVPNVRTYAANLRRTFEAHDAGQGMLVRQRGGYRLEVATDDVDLFHFLDQVDRARQLNLRDDPETARSLLSDVMPRWHGPPLLGVPLGASLAADVAAAQEQHLLAVEFLADLHLASDRVEEALPLLWRTVAAHPVREPALLLLMRALHRRGDVTGAISVFRSAARVMRTELGVEPGPDLRRLHQEMIERRPAAVPAAVSAAANGSNGSSARTSTEPDTGRTDWDWLPRPVAHFVGREALVERMVDRSRGIAGPAPVVHLIDGMAGSGKTTLAVQVARRLAASHPDGQLFIDLRGHDEGNVMDSGTALVALLRQLGVPAPRIPVDIDERRGVWRRELSARRAVVVLDNAADSDQVAPLLPVTASSVILITSRRRLLDLDVGPPESLSVLSPEEAVRLLAVSAGEERVHAEPESAAEIVRDCGYLPLAIRLVGSRLAHRRNRRLVDLAARLAVNDSALASFGTGERSVVAAFTASYEPLPEVSKRVFRLLGLHTGHYCISMVAAMSGLSYAKASHTLDDLVDCHLVEESEDGRYRMHDLVRQFAREECLKTDSAEIRGAALASLLDQVMQLSIVATTSLNRLIDIYRDIGDVAPERPDLLPGSETVDIDWVERERGNLNLFIELAAKNSLHGYTWKMARVLWRFYYVRGYFEDIQRTHEFGLAAAEQTGDRRAVGIMNNYLASALTKTGFYHPAVQCLESALAEAEAAGRRGDIARIRGNLSVVHYMGGDFQEAADLAMAALRDLPMRLISQVRSHLPNAGIALTWLGRYEEALRVHRLHLLRARVEGDRYQIANALSHIAAVRTRKGEHVQALRLLRSAMILYAETGHRYGEADARNVMGAAYRGLGLLAEARRQHELALELTAHSAERQAECTALNEFGLTLAADGDIDAAVRAHKRALDLAVRIDNRYEQARALAGLAEHLLSTDPTEARRHLERALVLIVPTGAPERLEIERRLAELKQRASTC
ncbi:BTAD domain-containing putative transcriptional regulator [Micromonospora sp. C95]|uniref:AfsR/SARP family transcriptional regulator n=1 Tax=Micromonospora sp. C95 TaxID=2824882 RepID=UPI001B39BCFB|nr:BTAD domain-containing putative transcriptional regulator [Micromonospora sp. C95]MBQ1023062.1 tetratricopeptide repeat protein [Micromonospora sp. C95]